MSALDTFAPFGDLAEALLPHAVEDGADGAHDMTHLLRVWANVERISAVEGGDREILVAATLLHDCVAVEKTSPDRPLASRFAAERARNLLSRLGWAPGRIGAVAHAIEAHSFSAGIAPETPEAAILRDADRLDAIGLIGVARCFYVAGRSGRTLYDPADIRAEGRALDDGRFALDHFRTKLLSLREGFLTTTGQRLAETRHARLERFLHEFEEEAGAAR